MPMTKNLLVSTGLPADHIVPPAFALGLAFIDTGDVVRGIERMTDHDGIALVGVELAIGLEGEVVIGDGATTLQGQRFIKMHGLRCGDEGHMKNPASLKRGRVLWCRL